MKRIDDAIVKQFEDLIDEGNKLITLSKSSKNVLSGDQISKVSSWVSKSGQIIKSICNKESEYYDRFCSILKEEGEHFYSIHSYHYNHLGVILGYVNAVYDDLKRGLIKNIKNLLRAEIFGDFLEMAEYLLNKGYKDPSLF